MIALHEEHGELVATWTRQGYRSERVICFDRHLDLKPLPAAAAARLARASGGGPDALTAENRKLPIREAAGSYGLDDFYAAGAALGAVSAMTWVRATDREDSPAERERLITAVSTIAPDPDVLRTTRFDADGTLRTRVCGLELTVRTPRAFAASRPSPDSRVDVDLDWFADVHTGQDHRPDELVDLLRAHGLAGNVDSMTFSVRSGFLPPTHRWLADELARALGRTTRQHPRAATELPAATFAKLRGEVDAGDLAACRDELAPLGAIGVVLLGLLRLRARADLEDVEQAWFDAEDAGCRSCWLAYGIALAHYESARFTAAQQWFARAVGTRSDTIEVRSWFMTALAALRAGEAEEGARKLLAFTRSYPLHLRATRLAIDIGSRSGEPAPDWLAAQARAQQVLVNGGCRP
ncbi:hypothetical protein [Amycolatopsis nigrescens]|uniref:hypothetical protein n=1 Tax=Amycolatopsis nigrescens TaxID=381445 RepID=UPI0003822856|nr:hypothetical protein [Amycolatopsis nigrescens]